MALHPAENRGYRELYLTGRAAATRLRKMAPLFEGRFAADALEHSATTIDEMLGALEPLTAQHDLHGRHAAQGSGSGIGKTRAAFDYFFERNQALRFAIDGLGHVANLLPYLGRVSGGRGDAELAAFCSEWESRIRDDLAALRRAATELGDDPDFAIEPVHDTTGGRAAHRVGWAVGTFGEWFDRRAARG
jgi:hypothetical protein